MSGNGLEAIDHTVQLTHIWIDELDQRLGWRNKGRSYQLLKIVLQALRDWLPANEMADFAAQFPTLLRGVYYEHWRPAATPVKHRSKADFLARIDREFVGEVMFPFEEAITTVFAFLSRKIDAGEIADVRQSLPADLRALWPAPAKAA
ncbi:MAG: DUF2267 domain-containing protein [Alphaproteobacteria bacterium]|nr:DUF2267 domain-containing protein [Alphaproteobacteria bacterium]